MPEQLSLREARRFRGVADGRPAVSGLRLRGSVDHIVDGLEGLGWDVVREPVESGPPGPFYLGALHTTGSPWLDVFEPDGMDFLSDELAASLSRLCQDSVLLFDYRFEHGSLKHRMYKDGQCSEEMDLADAADARDRLLESYQPWRMRDWGITLEDLIRRTLPFPPTAIVEAWFLRLTRLPQED